MLIRRGERAILLRDPDDHDGGEEIEREHSGEGRGADPEIAGRKSPPQQGGAQTGGRQTGAQAAKQHGAEHRGVVENGRRDVVRKSRQGDVRKGGDPDAGGGKEVGAGGAGGQALAPNLRSASFAAAATVRTSPADRAKERAMTQDQGYTLLRHKA